MTPFDLAAIKKGWTPLLHEELVYFKYNAENDTFYIAMCTIKKDYYDCYNEWIADGRITQEWLDKNIDSKIGAAFSFCISTPQMFHKACLIWVNDYKHHNIFSKYDDPERQKKLAEIKKFDKFIQNLK